jgi:hypothetical protein
MMIGIRTADGTHLWGCDAMATRRNPTEARQGWKPGIVRFMLLISFAATAAIFAIVYFYFYSPGQ